MGRATILRIGKWLGIVIAGLALLVAIVIGGLNTSPGRRFVVDQINGFETASGLKLTVGRIDGSLYGRMTLRDVRLHDLRGVFLTAPTISLDWRPFAYANGKVDVRALWGPRIDLLRVPETRTVPSDPNAPLLPDIDVHVGRLAIDRFVMAPAVLGRTRALRFLGSADIADGRARVTADAAATDGDRLTLMLDAVPQEDRLLIGMDLRAPAGGVVDSYTGLGRPLSLTVNGSGTWAQWTGQVRAVSGPDTLAALRIVARDGRFRVAGPVTAGAVLTGPAERLVAPRLDLDLIATLADRRADIRFAARSDAAAVDAQGLLDLGESRFGNFRLLARLLRPGAIAEDLSGRDVRFAAVLDGPMATPAIDYRLTASAIAFGTTGVEGLSAGGRAVIDADRIRIPVSMTARRVTGLNAAAGGLVTNLRADGSFAYQDGRLVSDDLRLRSDRIDATAIVLADIANGRYTGALKGRVNDYQVDGLGRISLTTDAELVTGPKGGFGVKGTVRVVTRRLDNESVRDFLGGNATTVARVTYDEDGNVILQSLRMNAPAFRITRGSGRYSLDTGRLAFSGVAQSDLYGPLTVTASGTVDRPRVVLRAARPGLGVGLADVEAQLSGTAAGYRVVARGGSDYGPFAADLTIGTARQLTVDVARATFAGVDASGRLVQTAAGPFAGTLAVSGSGLSGSVRLSAEGADQRADLDLRAANARIPGQPPITLASGAIRGFAILRDAGPQVEGDVALIGLRQDTLSIDRARARVRYTAGRGSAAFTAAGTSGVAFDIAGQASLAPDLIRANLRGQANGVAFRLAAPAELRRAGEEWRLSPATIVLPQGQVRVEGSYGDVMRARANLDRMDLSIAQAFAPGLRLGGRASGSVDYVSTADVPQVTARLTLAGLTRSGIATTSRPLDVALLGTLGAAGGDLRAVARRGGAVVGRVQARLAPLPAGDGAWTDRLYAAPLSGGIRYNGPAELLWSLTGIADQTLAGPIAIAADFGGRLDQPQLTGLIRADALRYENETYGTTLTGMVLQGRFTQSRLELTRLTARAGDGTIEAQGYVGLDSGFPIDLRATLRSAQLARSDELEARVSGTVQVLNGPQTGALIRGELNIPEARYQVVRQGAAEVPELTGIRRKGAPPPGDDAEEGAAVPSMWKLDLRIRADNRLFVSGMGLESEWRSDLRVTGSSNDPRVSGRLEVVRGTYSFAGRRFDLSRGRVMFEGGALTNPQLDIAADTQVDTITANITISGRAQNPQVTFSSTPALPQDEILSRLLFGGPASSLSPTQAIQLAAALNSLRGSGGGLNPLGKLRSATGIDRLRILGADQTAGRGTALAAGQYISNDVYVEIITDARGYTATQLEIALSKALSLLSQTGSFAGTRAELRYRKDY